MTVLDLSSLQIRAEVPELDVGRLAVGQPVDVTVNALPGKTLPGTVNAIDTLPGSGTSVEYGTVVTLNGLPPNLRPGMSASVAVTVAQAPDVTFLPSVAVAPIGGAGATSGTVQVLGPDGVPQARTIGLGLSSDTLTQVTSGIAPGELVVLPDPNTANAFAPGQRPPRLDNNGGSGGASGGSGAARSGG
jgi:macrolide-specific efflux system membrane fusion protein